MTREAYSLDVDSSPELAHLAGQVRASNRPLFLKEHGETVAILVPVASPKLRRRRRERTEADRQAFLSAAGSWKDVDVDRFLEDNAESRRISTKPAPDL